MKMGERGEDGTDGHMNSIKHCTAEGYEITQRGLIYTKEILNTNASGQDHISGTSTAPTIGRLAGEAFCAS